MLSMWKFTGYKNILEETKETRNSLHCKINKILRDTVLRPTSFTTIIVGLYISIDKRFDK